MKASTVLEKRKFIEEWEKEVTEVEQKVTKIQDEIDDLESEKKPFDRQIDHTNKCIKTAEKTIHDGLSDFDKIEICEDDVEWLSLSAHDQWTDSACLREINFNTYKKRLEACNGKMLFMLNEVDKSDFNQMQEYPNIEKVIDVDFKFTEKFDISNVKHVSPAAVHYTTSNEVLIILGKELLGCCLMIGEEITVSYSDNISMVKFECGRRVAHLMPRRHE